MPGRSGERLRGWRVEVLGAADVDVRDLVVGDGEGAGGHRVEVLHAVLGVHLQQSGAAQRPVDVDGAAHAGDAVLGQRDDGACPRARASSSSGARAASRSAAAAVGAGVVGAEALEVVVEVREVGEGQVGAAGAMRCRVASMIHWEETRSAAGPQKWKRGNGAELLGEFVVQGRAAGCSSRVPCGRRRSRRGGG